MKRFWILSLLALMATLCLTSCLPRAPKIPGFVTTATAKVEQEHAARVESDRKADVAIKTSADARLAEQEAKEKLRAAQALVLEYQSEVKHLAVEVIQLRNQEIASKITIASWWLIIAGGIVTAVGLFLALRFASKTAGWFSFGGGCCAAIGFVGLWLAPQWLLFAWILGGLFLAAAIALPIWLLHHKENAGLLLADELQRYASLLPDNIRPIVDQESIRKQPAKVKAVIDQWLAK